MLCRHVFFLFVVLIPYSTADISSVQTETWTLSLGDVVIPKDEVYLCRAFKVPLPGYIVQFAPHFDYDLLHHITIFGCNERVFEAGGTVWNCNDALNENETFYGLPVGEVCGSSAQSVLFVWHGAPFYPVPPGVGYHIGGSTSNQYVVLQIHYMQRDNESRDGSNMTLHIVPENTTEITGRDGVFSPSTQHGGSSLKPYKTGIVDVVCPIPQNRSIFTIYAFQVHTHTLGKVVSVWRVRDGNWTLIGRSNPLFSQPFKPVEGDPIDIQPGDIIASRCIYNNTRSWPVDMGLLSTQEMCTQALMYRTDDLDEFLPFPDGCVTPAKLTWNDFFDAQVPQWVDRYSREEVPFEPKLHMH